LAIVRADPGIGRLVKVALTLRSWSRAGLVLAQPSGRWPLYTIVSAPVPDALKISSCSHPASEVRSLARRDPREEPTLARMCYDHLAGVVGVSLTGAPIGRGLHRQCDDAT
jgi:hypothetical protein